MARKLKDEKRPTTLLDMTEGNTLNLPESVKTMIMGTLEGRLPERVWIAYHGKEAEENPSRYRPGEPGLIVNTTVPSIAEAAHKGEPKHWLKYMDGHVQSFPMSIRAFGPGKKPPKERDFLMREKQPALWAEMLPDPMVRPGARVIGRDGKDGL